MKATKKRLRIGRLMLSWSAVVSIVYLFAYMISIVVIGMVNLFTFSIGLIPLFVLYINRANHFYLMKRNVDFDKYRLDR
jgi:hypothetical protein